MADNVKLFGTWPSPFSCRVEMALKLKGVEYEYVEEDLDNKSALLHEYNPLHNKVPVLVHNGNPIVESLNILEYIDETWKNNPILPQHPHDRAVARFWANVIDQKIISSSWRRKLKEDEEGATKEFCELVKMLESQLKNKELFGGDNVGYLDIAGTRLAFWLPLIEQVLGVELLTAERFPELHRWIQKLLTVDSVVQCLPPREKHVQYLRQQLTSK